MHEQAIRSTFEQCLPVWPEWVAQLFERTTADEAGARTVRQLSYRFRVNGRNPETRTTAFVARLARLRQRLLGEEPTQIGRSLAELVFLATVVRGLAVGASDAADVRERFELVCTELQTGGKPAIERLLAELENEAAVMLQVGAALIELLQAAGTPVTGRHEGRTWTYHLNVLRSLVSPQRIASPLDNPLDVGPHQARGAERLLQQPPDHG